MAEVSVPKNEVIMRQSTLPQPCGPGGTAALVAHPSAATSRAPPCAGDKGNNFYIIKEGTCDVTVTDDSGEMKHVRTLTAGDSCGELSLLTSNPRSATIQVPRCRRTSPRTCLGCCPLALGC